MAMQGPIDTYWNRGRSEIPDAKTPDLAATGIRGRFRLFLDGLGEARIRRTNPKPESKAQAFHVRREVEKKLRFAYQLDPSHYANYNSYHFFLTEPELGTHPELTPGAAQLAQQTIAYCLSRTDDPRPALTAAAATENVLELMFNDQRNPAPKFTLAAMKQNLALLDQCIARYHEISRQWEAMGNWSLLSEQRRLECEDRLTFVTNIRRAAESTIQRLEKERSHSSAPN